MTPSIVNLVEACRRHALAVVGVAVAVVVAVGVFAIDRLGVDTDTDKMFSAELPWRQRQVEFSAAFPGTTDMLVAVVEAPTPERAERAAAALSERLAPRDDIFAAVWRPDADPYLRRNGLLFLPTEEVGAIAEQLIGAQAFIGGLAADPSLRGLFAVLGLALDGVAYGATEPAALSAPLTAVTDAAEAALAGEERPLSWQRFFTGREPLPQDLRRLVLARVKLDYTALAPGAAASAAIRQAALDLGFGADSGVRLRLTGEVALSDEEFATVAQGMGISTALTVAVVTFLLFLAVGSVRTILAILLTLLAGLVVSAGFAAAAVGSLNLISIAFVVLYVGLAVDFGIQFSVRYRDERTRALDLAAALRGAAAGVGRPLSLAAGATAVGFLALVPTDYAGIAELGLIAGVGMIVAVVLNLTLLPALLALLRPGGKATPMGWRQAAPVDRFLRRHARAIVIGAGFLVVVAAATLPRLGFDFDPLNLKDPRSESVGALLDLIDDGAQTPFTANIIAASPAAAAALAARLGELPEVGQALSLASFVPEGQEEKLAIIADLRQLLGPTLTPLTVTEAPDAATIMAVLMSTADKIDALTATGRADQSMQRLGAVLRRVVARGPESLPALERALLDGLGEQLAGLRLAIEAGPASLQDLPESIRADWVAADGRARVEVSPKGNSRDPEILRRFVAAVRSLAPEATGAAVSIPESGRTVVAAFVAAGSWAALAMLVLLLLVLRRPFDVLLVMAPLALAGVLTAATMVVCGLQLNFANIIALPLLFGIGVAFDIYFVTNWRDGLDDPLQSSTTRAVVFSALTTMAAFGSLAASSHPGMASMGALLAIELGYVLLCTLVVLPALLALARR